MRTREHVAGAIGRVMSRRANIVLIQAESVDGRRIGPMSTDGAKTPAMDRLAERGACFTQAYCNSPQCVPSRSSMWSGRHVHEVGAWSNYRGLPDDYRATFDTALGEAGYHVKLLGRMDHRSGAHSLNNHLSIWTRSSGVRLFQPSGPHHETVTQRTWRVRDHDWSVIDAANDWLRRAAHDAQPFFLYVGTLHTHPGAGYRTSKWWLEQSRGRLPHDPPPACDETHPAMRYMQRAKGCAPPLPVDAQVTCRQHYAAMIAELDAMLGEILRTLDAAGLTDSTYVIFNADHGDMNQEHGQYLKNAMYEASTRVPMLIAGPGIAPGQQVDTPVSLVDVFPTLMQMADHEPGHKLSGRSLLPALTGGAFEPRPVFAEYHANFQPTGSFMVRDGDWKYTAFHGMPSQLFNVRDDPDELRDLIEARPRCAARLEALLRDHVDYERIDALAKADDKADFNAWRRGFTERGLRAELARLAPSLDGDGLAKLLAWADASSG